MRTSVSIKFKLMKKQVFFRSYENTLILGNLKFYTANMYMTSTEKIDKDLKLINEILQLANASRILITMDSNSRSRTWHDKLTNVRGRELE